MVKVKFTVGSLRDFCERVHVFQPFPELGHISLEQVRLVYDQGIGNHDLVSDPGQDRQPLFNMQCVSHSDDVFQRDSVPDPFILKQFNKYLQDQPGRMIRARSVQD
jgi:hypothetical protein